MDDHQFSKEFIRILEQNQNMDINEDMASTHQGFEYTRRQIPKKSVNSEKELVPVVKNVPQQSEQRQLPDYLKKLPYKLKALKMKNSRTPLKYQSIGLQSLRKERGQTSRKERESSQ